MPGRSNPLNRCIRCRMFEPLCICPEIPKIELKTKIVVLMHWREQKLTTNTATVACMALPNSELHLRGEKNNPLDLAHLLQNEKSLALLYPTEDAVELNETSIKNLKQPLTLVVPDGSWRQAKKVALREPYLASVPKLKLPVGAPSTYRLRHASQEGNISTLEAISRALGVIEGPHVQEQLERLFLILVERKLWSRGALKTSECTTQIPEAAILASRLAGLKGTQRK